MGSHIPNVNDAIKRCQWLEHRVTKLEAIVEEIEGQLELFHGLLDDGR